MPWVVTLQISSCASNGSTHLAGASISDGNTVLYADNNGKFVLIVNDYYTTYNLSIGAENYVNKIFTISVYMNNTTQNVCLDAIQVTPPATTHGGW